MVPASPHLLLSEPQVLSQQGFGDSRSVFVWYLLHACDGSVEGGLSLFVWHVLHGALVSSTVDGLSCDNVVVLPLM